MYLDWRILGIHHINIYYYKYIAMSIVFQTVIVCTFSSVLRHG